MAAWALLIAVTIVPGLLWVWYFYRKDLYEPEPAGMVLKAFGLGMLGIIPAAAFELMFRSGLEAAKMSGDLFRLFLYTFLGIGLVEEGVKLAIVRLTVYRSPEFNEVMDGIVYGVSVGLGFAALENVLYARSFGLWVALSRAVLTCLAHALFTGLAGYYLALGKFFPDRRARFFLKALFVTALWHGVYDFLLLSPYPWFRFGSLLVVLGLAFSLGRKISAAQQFSPFRPGGEGE